MNRSKALLAQGQPLKKALIVEDNPVNLRLASALLRGMNFEVSEVRSAEEGMKMIETTRFDLLISDISLPGASGSELLKWINAQAEERRPSRVLAYTAHSLPEELEAIKAQGFHSVLAKPLTQNDLKLALEDCA